MTVEYTTSFEDYKAAQALYLRSRRGARLRFALWMYGLPILSIVCTTMAIRDIRSIDTQRVDPFGPIAILSIFMTFFVVVLRPYNLRRLYLKKRKLAGVENLSRVEFGFDETLVRSGYPERSEGQFRWNSIVDYAENQKIFLLFLSQKMFLYVPKRVLAEEQWQELRELLLQNGKKSAC